MEISQDEHERARNRSRRMAEHIRYSDMATSEERGKLERSLEIAKKLKAEGKDVDYIANLIGLTVDDILRL
jgi:UDP:flavonoid glycosyltransferase YjiC (YdhE family)